MCGWWTCSWLIGTDPARERAEAMCGIAGVVGRRLSPERISAVLQAQHHRGPDDQASLALSDPPVTLCHNRLSIIDLSPAAAQPIPGAIAASSVAR